MRPDRRHGALILGAFLAITAAHALLGRGTHPLHVVHVAFGALYLLPIVAAAVSATTSAQTAPAIPATFEVTRFLSKLESFASRTCSPRSWSQGPTRPAWHRQLQSPGCARSPGRWIP